MRTTMVPPQETDAIAKEKAPRAAVVIVALSIIGILTLSLWYLVQPQALLIQGEADASRSDIAARVDGRVATRPAHRGGNVTAGQVLVTIDNPELVARFKEAQAARAVAAADLRRIAVGTRAEEIDARRAALAAAEASAKLAEQSYERTRQLTAREFESVQKLDEATATLDVARRSQQQARLALEEAIGQREIKGDCDRGPHDDDQERRAQLEDVGQRPGNRDAQQYYTGPYQKQPP